MRLPFNLSLLTLYKRCYLTPLCSLRNVSLSRVVLLSICFVPSAVRELVVSAGDSVEVTLPRNAVELNAFVVSALPPGKRMEI